MSRSEDEAYDLFEMLSENSINHASLSSYERSVGPSKQAGLYEVRNLAELEPKFENNLMAQKWEKVDTMAQTVASLAQKMDQILSRTY